MKWMTGWMVLAGVMAVGAAWGELAAIKVLPEVVVTAMRSEMTMAEVPYTGYVVGGIEQQERAPRTTPDALNGLPSVMVQKTSYGQGSPYLRGFTGFRTLLLVDGIRLNNSVFRDGPNQYWNTVDPWAVDRYEVVMGPASVLYGSDAVGGTVNAIGIAPPEWTGQPTWERRLGYRGATADKSHQGRVGLRGRVSEQLGVVGGATWKQFGDLRGGRDVGRQKHSGYGEIDFDLRGDYWLAEGARLTLAHQQVNQDDAWRTHQTIYGIDWEGLKKGDDFVQSYDQDRVLTYLQLAITDRPGWITAGSLTLSRQAQEEERYRLRADGRSDKTGFDVTTWGASLVLESETQVGHWVYGADYYRDEVDSFSRKFNADGTLNKVEAQGPVADDTSYDLLGVFVQNTLPLWGGAVDVTPGARVTWAKLNANKVLDPVSGQVTKVDDDWASVVGSLRALAPLGVERRVALFAGVSQGFRAPNLSDLTRMDTARSGEIETPVTDLDPEQFVSLEAGVRLAGERLSGELAVYHTWIDDLIVRTPTGQIVDDAQEVTKRNAGRGYVQGVELALRYQVLEDWQVRALGSWMTGKVDDYPTSDPVKERDYLSRLMPLTLQAALRWQPAGKTYWLEAVVDAAEKANRLSASDKRDTQRIPESGTPGYGVLTLRGGVALFDALHLTLALENVTDEDYRIHGSGVNEPGRNLVVQAEWVF